MIKPCLKQTVTCRITRIIDANQEIYVHYEATNTCEHSLKECPKIIMGCKSGEDYHLCNSVHAEVNAVALAKHDTEYPGEAYIQGHTWICKDCQDALRAINVHTFTFVDEL